MAEVDDSSAGPHLADKGWIDVQKNTFKNWVNEKLKDTKCKVEVLEKGFADGITLIKLLEALSKKKMHKRHNARPRLDIQKRENLEIALEFMKTVEKIRLENIDDRVESGQSRRFRDMGRVGLDPAASG